MVAVVVVVVVVVVAVVVVVVAVSVVVVVVVVVAVVGLRSSFSSSRHSVFCCHQIHPGPPPLGPKKRSPEKTNDLGDRSFPIEMEKKSGPVFFLGTEKVRENLEKVRFHIFDDFDHLSFRLSGRRRKKTTFNDLGFFAPNLVQKVKRRFWCRAGVTTLHQTAKKSNDVSLARSPDRTSFDNHLLDLGFVCEILANLLPLSAGKDFRPTLDKLWPTRPSHHADLALDRLGFR